MNGAIDMKEPTEAKYYHIRASVFWTGLITLCLLFVFIHFSLFVNSKSTNDEEIQFNKSYTTMDPIESKLHNTDECYLCGTAPESLMGYYRNFDTIGVIALNEWYVLDLRMQSYDENGNPKKDISYSTMATTNTAGMKSSINATPSRGLSRATISSTNGMFDKSVVQNHLCQTCLDKVVDTMEGYFEEGKEEYLPFCLVDFSTLELYPMQKMNLGYTVRDYWIDLDHEDGEIELSAYYLPER